MAPNILFVDDEAIILDCLSSIFADRGFNVLTENSPEQALERIKNEEIAVVVSDQKMPGMHGIDLLARIKLVSPDTTKILMTGYTDFQIAVDAINTGEVFRFVMKPWNNNDLIKTVEEAVTHYQIVHSLKRADEATLISLAQTIELKDPYTKGHCDNVAKFALLMADQLNMSEATKIEIKHGSWLHDCGKIGVPEAILNYPGKLNEQEMKIIKKHPEWGADVAKRAQLSEVVVNIILYHHEAYDGSGYPYGLKGDIIPLEARIVSIADVYDALTADRPYRKAFDYEKTMEIMTSMFGKSFDPRLCEMFLSIINNQHSSPSSIDLLQTLSE
jgi:putative nucleotidyltransferase with HDIG domain